MLLYMQFAGLLDAQLSDSQQEIPVLLARHLHRFCYNYHSKLRHEFLALTNACLRQMQGMEELGGDSTRTGGTICPAAATIMSLE